MPAFSPKPGTMLSTPSGSPASLAKPAEKQRPERRLLGRLENDGIARDERRPELPGRDDERIVPRHDRADDAERLFAHHRHVVRADRGDLVGELVGELCVILDAIGAGRHVHLQRIGDRLADVERLEQRKLFRALADELGEAQEHPLLLGRVGVAPDAALEGVPRRFDRLVDVGLAAIGDVSEDLAVDRRDFGEGRAVGRRDIGAVDKGAAFDFERRGAGKPAFAGGGAVEHGFLAFFQISMEIARTIAFAWPDRNRIFRMAGCLTGMAPSLARSLHCALDWM